MLMPCKPLDMHSPYEQLFHKVPDVSHLKVFGSACYPFLRPYNHDKLDSRTTQCVFLGYALGYKGVFCYSIPQDRLWMSRHVVHDETIFPFLTHASSSSSVDPVTFFPASSSSGPLSASLTDLQGGSVDVISSSNSLPSDS